MTKIILVMALIGATLAGCATIEGVGRDISAGANRASNLFN